MNAAVRVTVFPQARCTRAVRDMIPPSPSLSARMMNEMYLIETISVIDQKVSETTPYTSPWLGCTAPWSIEKTVWSA